MGVVIEKKGGVTTPLRLFAVAYKYKGIDKIKVSEIEVTFKDGKLSPR